MNPIKAVIFDLDGVLTSTDEQHYEGWKALLDKMGIPFDREKNNQFRGVSRMACVEIIEGWSGKKFTEDEKLEYATWKNDLYRSLLSALSPDDLSSEVKETLDELRNRGFKLAIGSSSKNAKFILERIGLSDYFDAISDGTNITNSKPDPEVFLKAAEFLDISPDNCIIVEDAVPGVEAGKAAGMRTAAVGDAAAAHIADYDLASFRDLLMVPGLEK
ncbi:MAG: beta-phosphoglucomutase [Clostridiales bacterium]|nr:beta-phosphoglucomutase [Clostridiales bacterium]